MAGGKPFDLTLARTIGAQRHFRPGNAIQAFQGSPYPWLPAMERALRVPLNPNEPSDPLTQQAANNVSISWTSQYINSATESIISAQPNRVVLVVQNQSPTNPIAVNFDQTAAVQGTTPNFTSYGILLQPGVSLYIDKWCPTGTVHVSSGNPAQVTQGYSAVGNIPEMGVVNALLALLAQMQP